MGRIIIQATTYDPRVMKAATKFHPKVTSMYKWKHREDLLYGLEWMLAMWLWNFSLQRSAEGFLSVIEDITEASDQELNDDFISQIETEMFIDGKRPVINWPELWVRKKWLNEREWDSWPIRQQGPKPVPL